MLPSLYELPAAILLALSGAVACFAGYRLFRFVPMRVGVDESGTGRVAELLGLATHTGVVLALVRKARVLFWAAIGVAVIAKRGMSLRTLSN